jgi:hypothetical protein
LGGGRAGNCPPYRDDTIEYLRSLLAETPTPVKAQNAG